MSDLFLGSETNLWTLLCSAFASPLLKFKCLFAAVCKVLSNVLMCFDAVCSGGYECDVQGCQAHSANVPVSGSGNFVNTGCK